MAIDFLIFGVLLISFIINLLALAAFWVTPGLRTTANRFTINLLIINLIGCLILAPTLFLSTTTSIEQQQQEGLEVTSAASSSAVADSESIEFYSKPGNHQMIIRRNGQVVEEEGIIVHRNKTKNSQKSATATASATSQQTTADMVETLFKCNSTICKELTIDESSDKIIITEFEESAQNANLPFEKQVEPAVAEPVIPLNIRCWSIDMVAALGALAVLLVVGDTWCAVTDPLRYHSRISGVKAWMFIGLTWLMGLLFGALSAFRTLDFEADTFLTRKRQHWAYTYSFYSSNGIFDMTFACVYFVVIILLPFGFVCGMYWRIFSEARENGMRMRQNGSSPLLQSALNLTQHQQQQQQQQQSQHQLQQTHAYCMHRNSVSSQSSCGGSGSGIVGGLQMQIDHRRASPAINRRDSAAKVLLPTISDDGASTTEQDEYQQQHQQQQQPIITLADRNQNILLTLQSASGEIKRNYSARQLPLLGTSSQDLAETERLKGIRQVHSTPNLQKYNNPDQQRQDSLTDETNCSAHLLGYTQFQHTQQQIQHHQANIQRNQTTPHIGHYQTHQHQQQQRRHSHVLQIPGLHCSPKSFGYMSSLRHRLSNASSLFKYREESRAARISILVVFMFLVSYLPYGFLVLLQSRLPAANFSHSSQLAIFMILLGNLTSPFIFAYRNKRVLRGIKRLFGYNPHSHERSFHSQGGGSTSGRQNRASPAFIKRNSSKVSTYSLNSCKHMTPQNSIDIVTLPTTHVVRSGTLRPNASCSTIINFMLTKHISSTNDEMNGELTTTTTNQKLINEQKTKLVATMPGTTGNTANLVATKLTASKSRNLFKLIFKSSQNLSRSVKSCAQGNNHNNNNHNHNDVEPVEV